MRQSAGDPMDDKRAGYLHKGTQGVVLLGAFARSQGYGR